MDLLVDVFDKNIKKAAEIIKQKLGPQISKSIDLTCKNYEEAQKKLKTRTNL